MAARRNSNFTSILICFLITTNPDVGELSFLGFKLAAFNLWAVWLWLVAIWIYFYIRYRQYYRELGQDLFEDSYRKAERDLFPSINCQFWANGVSVVPDQVMKRSLTRAALSASDVNTYEDDSYQFLTGRGSFDVLKQSDKGNFYVPTEVVVKITQKERNAWMRKARVKASLERPALLTLNAPNYLFYATALLIIGVAVYELAGAFRAIPPIFLH